VIGVISRLAIDLQPILDTVCQTAAKLCSAENTTIWRLNDGGVATRQMPQCGRPWAEAV
jgi:hypothetical protein